MPFSQELDERWAQLSDERIEVVRRLRRTSTERDERRLREIDLERDTLARQMLAD